jgi:hypothetical protein
LRQVPALATRGLRLGLIASVRPSITELTLAEQPKNAEIKFVEQESVKRRYLVRI